MHALVDHGARSAAAGAREAVGQASPDRLHQELTLSHRSLLGLAQLVCRARPGGTRLGLAQPLNLAYQRANPQRRGRVLRLEHTPR